MSHPISIRRLTPGDGPVLAAAFQAQGWNKPESQFEQYWHEQSADLREVLVAEYAGAVAGYVTVVWQSRYPPFQAAGIPEIADFNVLQAFQRRGIGAALLRAAEKLAATRAETVGLGVGLLPDYGKAQIMYARSGYVPDGRGLYGGGKWLRYGDRITLDDDVCLHLTKPVSRAAAP